MTPFNWTVSILNMIKYYLLNITVLIFSGFIGQWFLDHVLLWTMCGLPNDQRTWQYWHVKETNAKDTVSPLMSELLDWNVSIISLCKTFWQTSPHRILIKQIVCSFYYPESIFTRLVLRASGFLHRLFHWYFSFLQNSRQYMYFHRRHLCDIYHLSKCKTN